MKMSRPLPLEGIRVLEFVHMVMGPTCGMILADMGADVIKVEPTPEGDNTRRLSGAGAGFWSSFNRNKRSIVVDMKSDEGRRIVSALIATADVISENFRPGAMDRLGFGYEDAKAIKPDIIYVSHKGFLAGPYEQRTALDEVVQMMSGLAYMTGLPGRPMRAGASVIDILGGLFGALGVLGALIQRGHTGKGQVVRSALFEAGAFLMTQHMQQFAVTGKAPPPMSQRNPAWGVYDIFDTADNSQLFVAVVTDTQWREFCAAFGLGDLERDPGLATNALRVAARDRLIPTIGNVLRTLSRDELIAKCEQCGLPYAPIQRPEDLFDDPHLNFPGGMNSISLPSGEKSRVPALPLEMGEARFGVRLDLPHLGEHTRALLAELGYSAATIETLIRDKRVVAS